MSRIDEAQAAGRHYDRVTAAWMFLLGDDFHYGYFQHGDEPLSAATAELTNVMVAAAGIEPGMRVLDVGCGIGTAAVFLAERWQCHVTGISTSEAGLERGRRRAQERGVASLVEFRFADATDNRLPDGSFDRVWALESSHLIEGKRELLDECARVLRTDGRLVLCDVIARQPFSPIDLMSHARELLLLDRVFGPAKLESLSVYERLAGASGLRPDVVQDLTAAMRPTFLHWRRNAQSFRAEVEELIGAEAWADFVESCGVLARFWDEGRLGYGLISARKLGA